VLSISEPPEDMDLVITDDTGPIAWKKGKKDSTTMLKVRSIDNIDAVHMNLTIKQKL
jgi:hypothetical protein